jgi:hypothetical protein
MTDMQVGRGIVDGSGNVVITLTVLAHNKSLLKMKKSPLENPRATKMTRYHLDSQNKTTLFCLKTL